MGRRGFEVDDVYAMLTLATSAIPLESGHLQVSLIEGEAKLFELVVGLRGTITERRQGTPPPLNWGKRNYLRVMLGHEYIYFH